MAQKGLGRGLSALFDDAAETEAAAAAAAAAAGPQASGQDAATGEGVQRIPVTDMSPSPFQPRQHFDNDRLEELAASMRTQGILQPLLVRPASEGVATRYEIIAGERRWRAAQKARIHEVPVLIRELPNLDAAEVALLENIQREDLSIFEEAEGYRRLIAQFDYSQSFVAERVGKSRSYVANALRLLAMPEGLRRMVEEGALSAGHARALLGLEDPMPLARQAVAESWSVRDVENAVKALAKGPADKATAPNSDLKDPDLREAEEAATSALGLNVQIRGSGTRGHVRVNYASLEQLELILAKLSN